MSSTTAVGATRRKQDGRARFAEALADMLDLRKMTQHELADHLGVTQSSVSSWKLGDAEPERPDVTFALEQALGVAPGALSRHLGYFPQEAVGQPANIEEVVLNDPALDQSGRRVVLAVYRELTSAPHAARGRRRTRSAA